jgi:hypothetical protein
MRLKGNGHLLSLTVVLRGMLSAIAAIAESGMVLLAGVIALIGVLIFAGCLILVAGPMLVFGAILSSGMMALLSGARPHE